MGERRKDALRVNSNRKLKLEFHGTKVTSDAAAGENGITMQNIGNRPTEAARRPVRVRA